MSHIVSVLLSALIDAHPHLFVTLRAVFFCADFFGWWFERCHRNLARRVKDTSNFNPLAINHLKTALSLTPPLKDGLTTVPLTKPLTINHLQISSVVNPWLAPAVLKPLAFPSCPKTPGLSPCLKPPRLLPHPIVLNTPAYPLVLNSRLTPAVLKPLACPLSHPPCLPLVLKPLACPSCPKTRLIPFVLNRHDYCLTLSS